jgi:TonB family protein
VASPPHNGGDGPSRAGYIAAIVVAALGHAALVAFAIFIAPRLFVSADQPAPAYTVKIVDNIPAGDLGTHLPRLAPRKPVHEAKAEPPKPEEAKPPEPKLAPDDDKNALALNASKPEPTPTPTPEPTIEPTPEPSEATPTRTPHHRRTPRPTPTPPPSRVKARNRHESKPHETPVMVAKAEATPSVSARIQKIREQLLKQHLAALAKNPDEGDDADAGTPVAGGPSGGGPVAASSVRAGVGYGVGPGTGSAGIQQDPEFLLYYATVQDKIKKAWNFTSGSSDLTAVVDYAIGPDGTLTGVKIAKSSNDATFDDSVLRAIRRAAPFAPPPEKYREQWAAGVEATFRLGDLKS